MSAGLQLIRSIVDNGSRQAMREISRELFIGPEQNVFDFVMEFQRRYGGLPAVDILAQQGFQLPMANGPVAYFMDRLRDRAICNFASESLQELHQTITRNDAAAIREHYTRANVMVGSVIAREDTITLEQAGALVLEDYERAREQTVGHIRGVPTGFGPLDYVTTGLLPEQVWTIAARPKRGKSYKLAAIAHNAWDAGFSVCFVTMEMSNLEMGRRFFGIRAGINPDTIRRGRLSMHGEQIIHDVVEGVQGRPPFHLMSGSFKKTTDDFDMLIQQFMPDLLIVDASYLASPRQGIRKDGSRWETVYQVADEMQAIARERQRPILQSVQLSRAKKRGVENDLDQVAGGDRLGQNSHVVEFLDVEEGSEEARNRRINDVIANREGETIRYVTNFQLNPPNFDVIGLLDDNDQLREWVWPGDGNADAAEAEGQYPDAADEPPPLDADDEI